jgi:hypothetical protein
MTPKALLLGAAVSYDGTGVMIVGEGEDVVVLVREEVAVPVGDGVAVEVNVYVSSGLSQRK